MSPNEFDMYVAFACAALSAMLRVASSCTKSGKCAMDSKENERGTAVRYGMTTVTTVGANT